MSKKTVLVVDDEQSIVRFAEHALQKAGFETLSASDGTDAIRLVSEHPVDCVLTDIVMPKGLGGVELFISLRRVAPNVPIIVMSGIVNLGSESFHRLADHFGVKEILGKPFTSEELLAAIDRGVGTGG